MKKFYLIAACAAIVATVVSCEKENTPVKMKTISVTMGCPQEEIDTKTQLNGNKVQWVWGDQNIICFTKNGADKSTGYALTGPTGTALTKTFTGEIPEDDEPLFYVYDRNRTPSASGHNFTYRHGTATYLAVFVDPDQRMASGGNTFHTGCNYTVARPGDGYFRHVFGFFKWTNTGSAIRSVKIEPLDGGVIIGYIRIDNNGDLAFSHAWDSGTRYVTSGIQDGKDIPADNSYYAIVYPRAYLGIKLTITLADGTSFAIKDTQTYTVERGKAIDLGVLPTAAL